jgi:hypothetical protein
MVPCRRDVDVNVNIHSVSIKSHKKQIKKTPEKANHFFLLIKHQNKKLAYTPLAHGKTNQTGTAETKL